MADNKKTNKKIKKTVSIKQSVEYNGKKSEVVVSNSEKFNAGQKDKVKKNDLLTNSIITSLNVEKEINNKVDKLAPDQITNNAVKNKNADLSSQAFIDNSDAVKNSSDKGLLINGGVYGGESSDAYSIRKSENGAVVVGKTKKNAISASTVGDDTTRSDAVNYNKEVSDKKNEINAQKQNNSAGDNKVNSVLLSDDLTNKNEEPKGEVKKTKKDNTNTILTVITLVCFICLAVVLGRFYTINKNYTSSPRLSNNSTINGVNVSGLNENQVETLLTNAFEEKSETFELTLTYENKTWTFNKDDFKVTSEIHTILEEAQIRDNINSSYNSQVNTVNKLSKKGKSLNIAFNYIFVGLEDKIDQIIETINYDATDSQIKFNPSAKEIFTISEHKPGLKVNKEQLYYEINEQFNRTNKVIVELPTLIIEPQVTSDYNKALTNKLSSFTSNVSDSTGNRKANVKLALQRINGLVVKPGEEVSFNKITGPHSVGNGYKVATIIYNGQFVDGVGGGVCQASTTLYNALLIADLEVLQVSKHTLPVKYVPLGLDAMVAEGVADLKFKNNHTYPIFIKTTSTSENVTVEIYGHELDHGMELKTRSEVIKKMPHSGDVIKKDTAQQYTDKVLYKGEQYRLTYPRNGFEAKAYLEYYKDGKLITQKEIRHEIYYPQQGIIIEGIENKPTEFKQIESNIEKIKPETQDTFMFSIMGAEGLIDTVPTNYCP